MRREIEEKMCKKCQGTSNRPILSSALNDGGQVDLIDYRALPDGYFKGIMHYNEHFTKFSFLRPLVCTEPKEVAKSLLDIF